MVAKLMTLYRHAGHNGSPVSPSSSLLIVCYSIIILPAESTIATSWPQFKFFADRIFASGAGSRTSLSKQRQISAPAPVVWFKNISLPLLFVT